MKKSFKFLSVALLLGALVACGGTGGDEPTSSEAPASQATSSKKTSSKHEHTYAETWEKNETQHWHPATCEHTNQKGNAANHAWGAETVITPATCETAGSGKKSCTVCQYETTYEIPATGHNYTGDEVIAESSDDVSKTSKAKCSCGKEIVYFDATDFKKISGTNNGEGKGYFKLKANGDTAEFNFKAPKMGAATFYFYGYIDYWKDGSTNNDQRGFFSVKNSENVDGNFAVSVGDSTVDISSKKNVTYEQMGIKGDTAEGSAWVEVGDCNITSEYTTVKFSRIDSYNMLILRMGIIYK
ncbi:MAG: hypothetical protein MJ238_02325 [Bacilli bacterium]|nr:hypothetical protein [Bacilli bacterium]